MSIDIRTIFITIVILNLFLVFILILFWKTQKTYNGFKLLVYAQCVLAVSYILYILRGTIPDFFSFVAANTLFVITILLTLNGIKQFLSSKTNTAAAWILPSIVFLSCIYFSFIQDNLPVRNIIISAAITVLSVWIAAVILLNMPQKQKAIYLFTALLYIIHPILLSIRAWWFFQAPRDTTLFTPSLPNSMYFLSSIIVYCGTSFSYLMWNHSRMNDELEQSNTGMSAALEEKEMLLLELNHRTKNNLQIISSMIRLRAADTKDITTTIMIRDIETRIETLSLVYQKLNRSGNIRFISLDEYIQDLAGMILQTFRCTNSVLLSATLDPITVPVDTAISIGIAINEIITNSVKHAFLTRNAGTIKIQMYSISNGMICIDISDNGDGMPDDYNPDTSASFGMKIIRSIIESQLKGKVSYFNSGGLHWKLEFSKE